MPIVTVLLVAANLLAYRLELASGGQSFCEAFGLVPAHFVHGGNLAPLVSSLFLHDPSSLFHIAGNMAFLALFGALVERALGSCRFLALYLLCGVAGALLHVYVNPASTDPLVGASGAIFGLIAVSAALYPRLIGFAFCFAAINVWHAFFGGGGTVSFGCHLGGFAFGVLVALALRVTDSEILETA
jgi:membrane associated rhomboid family serine protease